MSYGKKDEDADGAILKVDRTAVFQEGMTLPLPNKLQIMLITMNSATVQLLTYITSKMPYITYEDRVAPLHWRVLSSERSNRPFLWNIQIIPE